MVLNDIIEQAAGRQSRASDQGGTFIFNIFLQCGSLKYPSRVSGKTITVRHECLGKLNMGLERNEANTRNLINTILLIQENFLVDIGNSLIECTKMPEIELTVTIYRIRP